MTNAKQDYYPIERTQTKTQSRMIRKLPQSSYQKNVLQLKSFHMWQGNFSFELFKHDYLHCAVMNFIIKLIIPIETKKKQQN